MDEIRKERGQVAGPTASTLTIRDVMARAGLNVRFLYGPHHRTTTKPRVEAFVQEVNAFRKEEADADAGPTLEDELDEMRRRYEKLARHTNMWVQQLLEARRRIRDLERAAVRGGRRASGS